MTKFPVTKISAEIFGGAIAIRTGAAEKYRINLPESGAVFLKDDDESLNGAWVEKITYELARSMGIPAARYEFAEFPDGRKAIISFDYLRPNFLEQSGKMLLGQHFEQNKYLYTIETVLRTIDDNEILLPKSFEVAEIATAADLLAGYLIFDYWVDNIDRHSLVCSTGFLMAGSVQKNSSLQLVY